MKNLEEYRKARNSSNKKVNLAVYKHELSIAKDIKEKPKVFWRYANLKLKRIHHIDFLVENGDMITTPEAKVDCLKDIKEKPKVFWRYANLKLKRNHHIDFLVENGDMITTPEAKVDCLNRFFSSVFNTDSSIPEQELVEQDLTLGNIILSKKLILDKLTSIKD